MGAERLAAMRVPARAEHLHALREQVRVSAEQQDFCAACVSDLVLAVNEACMNVIQHGYQGGAGEITLEILAVPDGIEFRIGDTAPHTELTDWQPRDLKDIRPGGLGVHFIRKLMDELSYLPTQEATGNCLSMKKYRSKCRTEE